MIKICIEKGWNIVQNGDIYAGSKYFLLFLWFLAPLAKGQQGIVMAFCPLWVCNFFPKETSRQKVLTGFLPNFTAVFSRCSSFKFFQIIVFHEEFWLPWQPKKKNIKNLLLPNHYLDSIIILQESSLDRGLQNSFKNQSVGNAGVAFVKRADERNKFFEKINNQ